MRPSLPAKTGLVGNMGRSTHVISGFRKEANSNLLMESFVTRKILGSSRIIIFLVKEKLAGGKTEFHSKELDYESDKLFYLDLKRVTSGAFDHRDNCESVILRRMLLVKLIHHLYR